MDDAPREEPARGLCAGMQFNGTPPLAGSAITRELAHVTESEADRWLYQYDHALPAPGSEAATADCGALGIRCSQRTLRRATRRQANTSRASTTQETVGGKGVDSRLSTC